MYKGKEWLKKEVEEYLAIEGCYDARTALKASLEYIDQLEEPEQEKVVIPQFVGEYIEERKGMSEHWFEALYSLVVDFHNNDTNKTGDRIFNWIMVNPDLYVEGYRNGYSVEEQKLYKIKISKYDYLVQDGDGTVFTMDTSLHEYEDRFTEQEIKNIDERYWAFAEEITK